jgi:hypothetical protein
VAARCRARRTAVARRPAARRIVAAKKIVAAIRDAAGGVCSDVVAAAATAPVVVK